MSPSRVSSPTGPLSACGEGVTTPIRVHGHVRWWHLGSLAMLLALLLAGCGLPGTISGGGTLPQVSPRPTAAPLPPVRFPQDEAQHTNLTEWWYYTGHLASTNGREYGFELTFFQTLRGQFSPYYAAHFAVSDLNRKEFHYDERAGFEPVSVIPPAGSMDGFHLALGGWTASGLNGHDTASATMSDYAIQLTLADELPHPVLHGGDGLITYGAAGYSYYYSRPLLRVSGTIQDHGQTIPVTGRAWMDHQWGNFISVSGSGWDWYSIQLDNRTEYMLYIIRDAQKRPLEVFGTAIAADGAFREIPSNTIHIDAVATWKSPHTGGVYPSGWHIRLDTGGIDLTLTPQLRDQELVTSRSTGVAYWEGANLVSGTANGRPITGAAYVELTGYAQIPSASPGGILP